MACILKKLSWEAEERVTRHLDEQTSARSVLALIMFLALVSSSWCLMILKARTTKRLELKVLRFIKGSCHTGMTRYLQFDFTCHCPSTVAPRYNAVVGVHEMEPRYKWGVLYIIIHQGRHHFQKQQPKPMCWLHSLCAIYKPNSHWQPTKCVLR